MKNDRKTSVFITWGLKLSLGLMICLFSAPAQAGLSIKLDPNKASAFADQLGTAMESLEAQLSSQAEEAYQLVNTTQYLRRFADAQNLSHKGLGVDYSSDIDIFTVGVGVGVGAVLGDKGLNEFSSSGSDALPVVGASASLSIMTGLNLGLFGYDDLTAFANYFQYSQSYQQFTAKTRSFGVHLQQAFLKPDLGAMEFLFKWGGVSVTGGYEYSAMKFSAKDALPTTSFDVSGENSDAKVDLISTGTAVLSASAHTVAFDVTTSARFLYVLGIYGGVGLDWLVGTGSMKLDIDGDLKTENPSGGEELELGETTIEVDDSARPNPIRPRVLLGLQLNLSVVKLFVQATAMSKNAASAAVGMRVAW